MITGCNLGEEEAYMVSYLVNKGWKRDSCGWSKDGFYDTKQEWVGGSSYRDVRDPYFESLYRAHQAQIDSEG